jgi:hypothetical protein
MNATASLLAIASLLLALSLAGDTAKDGALKSPAVSMKPSRIAINHNETFVRDTTMVRQADPRGDWLASLEGFVLAKPLIFVPGDGAKAKSQTSMRPSKIVLNHNETMVREKTR